MRPIILSILLLFLLTPSIFGQIPNDTTAMIGLITMAEKCSSADSSVLLYKKAVAIGNEALKTSLPKNIRNTILKKTIIAELGLGLIYYQRVEYEVAIQHYELASGLAKELNDHYYLGECLFNFGEVYLEQSKFSLAMTRYFEAMKEYELIDDNVGVYWCYIGMGIVQKHCGNFGDAVICYNKALSIAESEGLKTEAAYCHNNIGIVYRREGNFAKAMENFEKALKCFSESNDELAMSDCYTNIGNLYLDKGDPFKALDYYNKAIGFEKVKKDAYRMISRYKNLSDVYTTLKDYHNASLFLDKAISLAEKSDDKILLAACYSQIGGLHLANGSSSMGISYLGKAVDLFSSVGAKSEEGEGLIALAQAELKAGKLNDAFDHASKGEQLAYSTNVTRTLYNASNVLSSIWEKKGDTRKALSYLQKAIELKDTIFSIEKNRTVEEIEAGFTRTRLESENQLLQQRDRLQKQSLKARNIAVGLLSVCLILAVAVIWLVYGRHIDQKKMASHEKSLKEKQIVSLNESLQLKDRELASKTIFINQKNNLLQKFISELDSLKGETAGQPTKIDHLQRELKSELSPNAWKEFEVQFNEVHPGFQNCLLERFPELSPSERRLCAFLRLNMNTREIASLTGQSFKSIEVARTRIRKKMGLSHEDNLTNFIASL